MLPPQGWESKQNDAAYCCYRDPVGCSVWVGFRLCDGNHCDDGGVGVCVCDGHRAKWPGRAIALGNVCYPKRECAITFCLGSFIYPFPFGRYNVDAGQGMKVVNMQYPDALVYMCDMRLFRIRILPFQTSKCILYQYTNIYCCVIEHFSFLIIQYTFYKYLFDSLLRCMNE